VTVSIHDAAALARLVHEVEHDRALIERDQAVRERDELLAQVHGALWTIRNSVVRQHGQETWRAIMAEVRREVPGRGAGIGRDVWG
jgi:hypothetical protein